MSKRASEKAIAYPFGGLGEISTSKLSIVFMRISGWSTFSGRYGRWAAQLTLR
ncbi:hypothetical protein L6773_01925 [Rhodohalobacter sp. WB101]|uniref:Uncharacterized protein n=1 Tax=Rhodohalobacter sulfatireducens TaxID=2911366 RepID=A0ABS9K8Y6_9BACT|nr:hypothetical protein [Rhodohalobacter sulfatireducens]